MARYVITDSNAKTYTFFNGLDLVLDEFSRPFKLEVFERHMPEAVRYFNVNPRMSYEDSTEFDQAMLRVQNETYLRDLLNESN